MIKVFKNSYFLFNLQQLNGSVQDVQTRLNKLTPNSQTSDLRRARKVLSTIVNKVIYLFSSHNFALTNLATDKTIPIKDLFKQYGKAYKRLEQYVAQDHEESGNKMKEIMGCPAANGVQSSLGHIDQQVIHMAKIIKRLKQFAFNSENGSSNVTTENSGRMAQIVNVLASNVLNLKSSVSKFAAIVDDAVIAIESANTFLSQLFYYGNSTQKSINTSRIGIRTALNTAKVRTLGRLQDAQQGLRKDLGSAIVRLIEFFTSKKFLLLSKSFDDSYHGFYLFLRRHSRSTVVSIKNNFQQMAENLDAIVTESTKIFFGAMLRTAHKLVDIILERGSAADTCFKTHSTTLSAFYQSFTTLIQVCFYRENPRWSTLADAVDIFGNLLRLNSNELSANIGRCVTYTKFASSTSDYLQAKHCIQTVSFIAHKIHNKS